MSLILKVSDRVLVSSVPPPNNKGTIVALSPFDACIVFDNLIREQHWYHKAVVKQLSALDLLAEVIE